jgi:glyoxylase-like metal-dependent hydrolase (beta-lactamase superfamily II)
MAAPQTGELTFDRSSVGVPGELKQISPLVRRMVAGNSGPMTFTGTCTYVVGAGKVAVIDPGPDRPDHLRALLDALAGEAIESILVTHTHRDHSPGARALKQATGAPIAGCAPYAAPPVRSGSAFIRIDAANDFGHAPDTIMRDGDTIDIADFSLVCVETPGHSANHLAFALPQENALFSGDHVMAWATSVVVPPDGTMGDYMASLEKLRARDDRIYWPGHGGPVADPQRFVRALAQHRRRREKSILASVRGGDSTIESIVRNVYEGLDPALRAAAGLSVFAHLEDLIGRGLVTASDPASLTATFQPV